MLEGYLDANWMTSVGDNKSTSGWIFTLGGGAISWPSKKQSCISHSTMDSEFIALASAGKEVEWLRNMLYDIELWQQPMSAYLFTVTAKPRCQKHTVKSIMESLDILV